ncbi:TPA: hypothetical protein CPT79_08735 [Candidatus Gastranaerophilales bacterium HUM_6]|nr:unknown [Fusobacterium sp. CAG:815]DAA88764.1 MAG TPA: hypothetical protein CPT79_08735 [Candidatus Gastranaerophilales bacterium HUM_6]DAA90326.1 MAG TPA: hypothetical protein CPT93_08805 [Candidatus Gastranaerophilales bacterium HUM_7]DAB03636.1 MAG TPA: hypothetical protein CPT84_02135 [Candidatus Gastranaerophilales bacterium HUM_12]DAB08363.1 MAG TPA: hypothetical protein CPT78_01560 [Candidatus Gastranaerophilales bacterium HUM_14]
MNICSVQFGYNCGSTNFKQSKTNLLQSVLRPNSTMERQPVTDIFKAQTLDSVTFQGHLAKAERIFENKFNKIFFRKIANEHLPCAYTGIEMISQKQFDELIQTKVLTGNSADVIKELKKFEKSLFPVENGIFNILKSLSEKYPEKNLQELLKLKYPIAEKNLIQQQAKTLNQINMVIRDLPKEEFLKIREIVQESFDKIFAPNPNPQDRFKRKALLYKLKTQNLTNKKIQKRIIKLAEKLPNSETSVNSFIVKYSEPYRIRYENKNPKQIPQTSEEIALRLLRPSLATEEHIYPQAMYRAEELAARNGDETAKNLSKLRVTILTSNYINEIKKDFLFDDFAPKVKYNINENIQKHINKLIKIDKDWLNHGKIEDAALLTDYIMTLKEEFQRRSKIINIDIKDFEEKLPEIKDKIAKHIEKMENKKSKKVNHSHK